MSCEKPQFTETEGVKPNETQLACLEEIGFADDPSQKFEKIPIDKMRAKDIIMPGSLQVQKAYYPANPPEPPYSIDENDIRWNDKSKLHEWKAKGKVDGNTDCKIMCYWNGDKKLHQVNTVYTNDTPGAKQLGVDIPLVGASATIIPNVKRDIRTPVHDPKSGELKGFTCVLESYLVKAADVKATDTSGDYLVYIVKSFESVDGHVEKTVEDLDGQKSEYFYRTRVKRYAGLAADGKTPVGLKTDTFYGDQDGDTTKKLREIKYTDAEGKPTPDGKPVSTIVYDLDAKKETPLQTVAHKQFNGATVMAQRVKYNYMGIPGAKYISDFNEDGQTWKTRTLKKPDGTTVSKLVNDTGDGKQLTLNLYRNIKMGPGEKPGSGTIVYQVNEKDKYAIQSMAMRDASDKPITTIVPPGGHIIPVYNEKGILTGVKGATFYKNGKAMTDAEAANIFTHSAEVHKAWQEELFGKKVSKK